MGGVLAVRIAVNRIAEGKDSSIIPGGGTGRSFTNEYGYVGVAVVQDEIARVNIHGFNPRSSTEKFGNLLNIK